MNVFIFLFYNGVMFLFCLICVCVCVCVDLTELWVGGSGNFLPKLAIGVYLMCLGRASNISVLISLCEEHRTVK